MENTPYVTLEEANAYFTTGRLFSDEFLILAAETQQAALNWATRLLLSAFSFSDGVLEREEDREAGTGILRLAICDQALHIAQNPTIGRTLALHTKGFQAATMGPMNITLSKEFVAPLIPEAVRISLERIGTYEAGTADGWTIQQGLVSL